MKRTLFIVAALALLVAVWIWKAQHTSDETSNAAPVDALLLSGAPAKSTQPKAQNAIASERSPLADALNSPRTDIHADLRLVSDLMETFRSNFPRIGNPVGNNAEITAALTGGNKLRLALIPPNHSAINRDGELCDRWGTPFFFHAESATRMEIRSAGPDKKMWTNDDVTFVP